MESVRCDQRDNKCKAEKPDEACRAPPNQQPPGCVPGGKRATQCNRKGLRQQLRDYFPTFEVFACHGSPVAFPDVPEQCPFRCGRCLLATAPSEAETLAQLMQCSDDATYEDWLGERCSWYFFNDRQEGYECYSYGTERTRERCRLTCSTCKYTEDIFDKNDQDFNGRMDPDEFNAVLSNIGYPMTTRRAFPTFLPIAETCAVLGGGDAAVEACVSENSASIARDFMLNPYMGVGPAMQAAARNLIKAMDPPLSFLGPQTAAKVDRFATPAQLTGKNNIMLSSERAVPAFPECSAQADCEGQVRYACGDVANGHNQLCKRKHAVPMYCAETCYTGGCAANASVLPNQPGRFCQPCDACFVAGGSCPDSGGNPLSNATCLTQVFFNNDEE